ncbi:MAG: deoxyguanosinetriphosphate triphosphohydrolase [Burkholderiaceae bacterium]
MPRAAWAADPARSAGRMHAEPPAGGRTAFQRDRDRIVHCTAFRRLEYKTQVFINHEGDLYRTRLTHSIEVAQIARTVARALGLDEDLTEAVSLAHDLGHTPFGHAGQDALDAAMTRWGGFEHNLQSLRVVDELEQRYAAFDGLNLSFETREGILKRCRPELVQALGEVAGRFLRGGSPCLEAQIANLADEIAYSNHDVDDGLRAGLIDQEALQAVDLFARHRRAVLERYPALAERRLVHETIRRMISELIEDLTGETLRRVSAAGVGNVAEVRASPPLAAFSAPIRRDLSQLKRFLAERLYQHPRVEAVMDAARAVVGELFESYRAQPQGLPAEHRERFSRLGERAIADYIAGMTDRFAIRAHHELTGRRVREFDAGQVDAG